MYAAIHEEFHRKGEVEKHYKRLIIKAINLCGLAASR